MRLQDIADMLNNNLLQINEVYKFTEFDQGTEDYQLLRVKDTFEVLNYSEEDDCYYVDFPLTMQEWADALNNETFDISRLDEVIDYYLEVPDFFTFDAIDEDDNMVVTKGNEYLAYDSANNLFYSKKF